MAWLTGYTYRKKGAVNSTTAGAQTNYQLKLVVGESSGASGEDVDCESHCLDFHNDIRFTKEDGTTKHDYWIDTSSLSGTTPNRKVDVWIEVASIPASGSVEFYMYYCKASDSSESSGNNSFPFFDDFGSSETLQITKTTKDNVHLSSDYCMDPNMCMLHDGTWFVVFREGTVHTYSSSGKARFVTSTNKGESWSSASTIYDTANKDDRQPNVFEFQEGGVWTILVAWTVQTANPIDDNCESVKVIKSTNGGTSWGTPVTVTSGDDMRVTGNPIQMANGNILLPLTAYVTGKKRNKVAISDDDGNNWTIYNATDHYSDGRCNEWSAVEYEAGKLLGITRNQAASYFNKITSADYGVTWTAPVLTNVPSPKDRPHLILLQSGDIALTYAHTNDDFRIVRSSDNGVSWDLDNYSSVYYESGIAAFSGYPASIEYEENKVFSIFEIQASSSDEDIYGNKINTVDVKWDVAGAISVSNGIVHLDNDDWITGKTAFGNGYCYETRAKANEQDTCFVVACQTHNVWNDDNIVLGNSDLYPNDFDRFFLDFWKAASQNTVSIDNWNDFRDVYYRYRIKKISNSKVIMEQELNSSTYTNSTYITTENLKLACRVWDSSQESQLDVDFALVRKYTDPEPTWGSWGAEGVAQTGSDTGSGADIKSSLSIVTPSETILDSMNATTGWSTDGAMTSITVNTTTKQEGTGALNLIKANTTTPNAGIIRSISSENLTSKYVKVWLYLKDITTKNKIASAEVNLIDSTQTTAEWHFPGSSLSVSWNLLIVDTETIPDYNENPDLTDITEIQLYVNTNQATDTYTEGDVVADYYHYVGFDISDTGSGTESGIVSKQFIESDTGSGVEALDARSFCAEDSGIGEESFPPVFGAYFNIIVADGTSTKEETIPDGSRYSNIYISEIFLKVPALSTASKTVQLELLTERNNVIFSTIDLDASIAKSYSFHNLRALKGATKYKITTDANVTGAKAFEIEFRGLRTPYSLTEVGLSDDDTGSGTDIKEDILKVTDKTGSDTGSGVDALSSKDFSVHDNGSAIEASSFSYRDCISTDNGSAIDALGSRELARNDIGTGIDVGERRYPPAESRGFYYAKIGSTIFRNLNKASFRITEELNKIPSFEFEISNSAANRAAITAGITDILRIYHRHDGSDTLMFTGIINGDAIEYLSLERIRLVGYASYIDLNWRFHQHLNSEDAEDVGKCFVYSGSYSDKTTAANNDTINDVTITFSSVNDAIYIGQAETFFGMQVKYSTKGVQAANTTVIWEYSEGSSVWSTLHVLDETRQFTQDTGTYYITIPHKPSDWAKETVNSVKKFWIRARLTAGSYSTQPKLDRIKMMNIDPYRVYYFDTAASTIMDEVLDGTGYSMDVTDACPSDTISIVAEYETKLRMIAGVANALTWDDSGDKRAYQWWVDTSKKVHFKQKRGSTLGDITKELTILNNVQDYFNLSNRLHFLGNYDGLNQLRAVIENTDSQDTHEIRELAVPEERYNNYIPLKEAAQKAMTYTKAPLQKIAATVTTKYWLDEGFEVGDTVTLKHARWNVDETAFQIVRADIGPRVTNLDMGISQEHLDGLKAGLQRQLDISGIRMHGSTSLLQFGPETMNYHRVDATTVYPARLKIEVPSDARYIHKVLLSWTIGNFRADVGPTTGTGGGHDHTGYAGAGGEHDHTGFAGSGGAFTPEVMDAGVHTPVSLSSAHVHEVHGTIPYETDGQWGYLTVSEWSDYESVHTHSNPYTGMEPNHSHSFSDTSGGPSGTTSACVSIGYGTSCTSGSCVDPSSTYFQDVASAGHTHYVSGTTGSDGGHDHSIGSTGAGSSHRHRIGYAAQYDHYITDITFGTGTLWTSELEDPAHIHDMVEVPDHSTPGVYHGPHTDHGIVQQAAHSNHVIFQAVDFALDVLYQIYEVAAGTVMELIVNGETVGSNYEGAQTDIRIDGYMQTGTNTVEIQPIATEVDKKGGATMKGDGILFIEPKKF